MNSEQSMKKSDASQDLIVQSVPRRKTPRATLYFQTPCPSIPKIMFRIFKGV